MTATAAMMTEGLNYIAGNGLKASALVANYYVGLCNYGSGNPAITDTLASTIAANEMTTTNTAYARQAVAASALTITTISNNKNVGFPLKTFGNFAGSALPLGMTHFFIATSIDNSGVVLCAVPLNTPRTYGVGDNEVVTANILFELGP